MLARMADNAGKNCGLAHIGGAAPYRAAQTDIFSSFGPCNTRSMSRRKLAS